MGSAAWTLQRCEGGRPGDQTTQALGGRRRRPSTQSATATRDSDPRPCDMNRRRRVGATNKTSRRCDGRTRGRAALKQPRFSRGEPKSLYHRDSLWISSYHIHNSFQLDATDVQC
jgi:hypothetical protein